jgi:3-deoxy-7-phosphoheptulonate synthase
MCLAAIAAGAHGLIIEVHHNPAEALSDGDQSMTPDMFSRSVSKIKKLRQFMEKSDPHLKGETGGEKT